VASQGVHFHNGRDLQISPNPGPSASMPCTAIRRHEKDDIIWDLKPRDWSRGDLSHLVWDLCNTEGNTASGDWVLECAGRSFRNSNDKSKDRIYLRVRATLSLDQYGSPQEITRRICFQTIPRGGWLQPELVKRALGS
jgi:hypothetical protein